MLRKWCIWQERGGSTSSRANHIRSLWRVAELNSEVEGKVADSLDNPSKTKKLIALGEVIVVRFVIYALVALGLLQLVYGSLDPSPFPLGASYLIGTLWFAIPALMITGSGENRENTDSR
jgi:hypothetical protein